MLLRARGDATDAVAALDRAHALSGQVGDRATSAHVALARARAERDLGSAAADGWFARAIEELELIGDRRCAGQARTEHRAGHAA
jgi:predicted trehalose synthase